MSNRQERRLLQHTNGKSPMAGAVDLGGTPAEREFRRKMSKARPVIIAFDFVLTLFTSMVQGATLKLGAGWPEGAELIGITYTPGQAAVTLWAFDERWPARLGNVPIETIVLTVDGEMPEEPNENPA